MSDNLPTTPIEERPGRGTWLVHPGADAANPNGEAVEFEDFDAAVAYAEVCDRCREDDRRGILIAECNRLMAELGGAECTFDATSTDALVVMRDEFKRQVEEARRMAAGGNPDGAEPTCERLTEDVRDAGYDACEWEEIGDMAMARRCVACGQQQDRSYDWDEDSYSEWEDCAD